MDLTQQTSIQCINCHSNIFESSPNQQQVPQGPICEHCLFYQSKLINQENQQIICLKSQLLAIRNEKTNEDRFSKGGLEITCIDQKQMNILNQQLLRLINQQNILDETSRQVAAKYATLCRSYQQAEMSLQAGFQQYGDKLYELNALAQSQSQTLIELRQLLSQKQKLLGFSVLMEIYHIHFDDQYAFINSRPVTIDHLDSLLEIISYLIRRYNYPFCEINSVQNEIVLKEHNLVLQKVEKGTPLNVKKWLQVLVKQIGGLWQHIKQVCSVKTKQNYDCYVLPFKMVLEPQLSINGKLLSTEKGCASFLKYFTHNIKYIISFDFDVQLRSIGKCHSGTAYASKFMQD